MTVICMDCQKKLEEKCRRCGVSSNLRCTVEGKEVYLCVNLDCPPPIFFSEGEGGISHGLCLRCECIRFAALGSVVIESQGLVLEKASEGATHKEG
jgi:hypothetical protein